MRLKKTAQTTRLDVTYACKEQLLRRGFKPAKRHPWQLRLGGNKPGEVYNVWFPSYGYLEDRFFRIHKRTVAASKDDRLPNWGISSYIVLILV